MEKLIESLQDKDYKKAYAALKEIQSKSAESDAFFHFFNEFSGLLAAKNSYVRTRGFLLCCAQARWDTQGKLQQALPTMFLLLHDEKPSVARQCLRALHEVVLYRPELCERIKAELLSIDLSQYQDSMAPLIQKDIHALLKAMKQPQGNTVHCKIG